MRSLRGCQSGPTQRAQEAEWAPQALKMTYTHLDGAGAPRERVQERGVGAPREG